MSSRRALVALTALAFALPAWGAMSPSEAASAVLEGEPELSDEQREEAAGVLERAIRDEPDNDRWRLAYVNLAGGAVSWSDALPHARWLVEDDPDDAERQYVLGTALFSTIDEVSMINKGARASAGKSAYERALEIDPSHVNARIGLFQFHLQAPWIAGGRAGKARDIAEQLASEPENAFMGNQLLAQWAASEGEWDVLKGAIDGALEAASDDRERRNALALGAQSLLSEGKDEADALAYAERYLEIDEPDDYVGHFLRGAALHGLNRYGEAIEPLERVLELQPDARNTRYYLAECYEQTGRSDAAAEAYAAFAEKFPEDDRADRARRKVRRLQGD